MPDDVEVDERFVRPPPGAIEEGAPEVPPMFVPGYAAVLDFLLKFEIPPKYKDEFDRFKPVLTQALALANIRRDDIPHYMDYLDLIIGWYKADLPNVAREYMVRMVSELMLTRSVDGLTSKLVVTSRREQVLEGFPNEPKEREGKRFKIF